MSIWKSPIFYLGIVLLLVVGGALLAPFVVNWNAYRDTLESYGRNITGRNVAINGDISARLFPWPRLVLNDVSIANPAGFVGTPIIDAKTITMQLNLAGLMGGEILVDTITVDQPVVSLWRQASGKLNWIFTPEKALQKSNLLAHVKLDQIIVRDGVFNVQDEPHSFETGLSQLNISMAASGVEGPWRVRGTARHDDVPLAVSFTSQIYKPGEPFGFGVRLEPQDGTLPALAFDGALNGENLKGKLLLEPVVTADGRESLEGTFKPLQLKSDLEASFNTIAFNDIQITPADRKDNGTLIQGSASASFENGVKAIVKLDSPRLDLDALAGSQSLRVWRAGGVMAVLNTMMKDFPKTLDLAASLKVASVSAAGETIENLNLDIAAEQNAVRVKELSGNLPGRSRMKFNGVAFPGDIAAQLGGSLAFESNDVRQFSGWLWPEGKSALTQFWTGARGRLKAQSNVDWSGQHFLLQDLKYELDGAAGDAALAVQLGALPAVDFRLNAKLLDLDNYMRGGLANFAQASGLAALLQSDGGLEKRLSLHTDVLRVNGVEAQKVALEFDSSLSGISIKTFEIGSVEGASLRGQGLVLQSPDGPSGDVKAKLMAQDPRGFLRLLGVTAKAVDPVWTKVLGNTDVDATVSFRPGAAEPVMNFDMKGNSGPLQISLSGDVKDLSKGSNAIIRLNSELKADDSAVFAQMVGWHVLVPEQAAGKVVITALGSQELGFKADVTAEIFKTKLEFSGQAATGKSLPLLTGKISATAESGADFIAASGVPVFENAAAPLRITANVAPLEGGMAITEIAGQVASQNIGGNLQIAETGKINADFTLDNLKLSNLLSAAFMPWSGTRTEMGDAFSANYRGSSGEIWMHPKTLQTDFGPDLKEAVLGVSYSEQGRQATVAARDAASEPFKLDLAVAPKDGAFAVSGSAHFSLDLARVMTAKSGEVLADGSAVIDAKLAGVGRSPLAALSQFSGEASYVLRDAKLTRLSPQNFFPLLKTVKNADDLTMAFAELEKGPGLNLSAQQLAVKVQNGALVFEALAEAGFESDLKITPSYDLSTQEFETRVDVIARDTANVPAMQITYSGLAGELQARSDTSEIATKFGYQFMARDLAELERVQKEQARIAAEELAQQKADEIKFAAFQAQRNELRLRQREQRVFAAQRLIDAEREKARWAKIMAAAAALTKIEIKKFLRQVPAPAN